MNLQEFSSHQPWSLHWFRRDLRITGNESLLANVREFNGKTLCFATVDPSLSQRHDYSRNRFSFYLESLRKLKKEITASGGELLVVNLEAMEAFSRLINFLKLNAIPFPRSVSFGRDYEPETQLRDAEIIGLLKNQGITVRDSRDHLVIEPGEIKKNGNDHDAYKIYSPYARKWLKTIMLPQFRERISCHKDTELYFENASNGKYEKSFSLAWESLKSQKSFPLIDSLEHLINASKKDSSVAIPRGGFINAYRKLKDFARKVDFYEQKRDFPAEDGVSGLSLYLANGSISTGQIIYTLGLMDLNTHPSPSRFPFLKQLIWREFYYSILYHFPFVEKGSFLPQYRELSWKNDENCLRRWKEGSTGFPIVDAGMRQLNSTGFMHNRVRMIVASFLTKDLLIDWRLGEAYFMQNLLDGDLAANNGGWQWAASTGCDPQPYFRVFNPWLQSQRFDPEAVYIKKYIPELSSAPAKMLHSPESNLTPYGYPKPIVDHAIQKEKAILMYKKLIRRS